MGIPPHRFEPRITMPQQRFNFMSKAKSASAEQKGPARDRAYPDTRCCRASEASRVFVPAQALCSVKRKRPFVRTAGEFGADNGVPAFAARTPTPPSQARSGEFLKTCHWHVFLTEFHLIGSSPRRKALPNGSVVFFPIFKPGRSGGARTLTPCGDGF